MGALDGKVALITGTSKGGIGTAIATRFAAEGARIAMAARDEAGLAEALARVEAAGSNGVIYRCDLAKAEDGRDTLVERTEQDLGPIDILINNAAAGGYQAFTEWDLGKVRRMAEVNVYAPWILARDSVASMRARGSGGTIINVSSASATVPEGPYFIDTAPSKQGAAYGGTKAWLNRMTLSLAHEVSADGISANTIEPHAAAATPSLIASGWLDDGYFEPLDMLAQTAVSLCGANPHTCTGRILSSLEYLVERGEPVWDLTGGALVDGWQPEDIPERIAIMRALQARRSTDR